MADNPRPLMVHLLELRRRLLLSLAVFLVAFCVCYVYAEPLFQFLVQPLAVVFKAKGLSDRRLIYTGLTEAFVTYIKVAAFAGAFITFPFAAIQVWRFIAPGLYAQERILFRGILMATPVLFVCGAFFAYAVVFPVAYDFFLGFESPTAPLPVQLEARVSEYLSFVMRLIFAFGLCFELPILLSPLTLTGVLSPQTLLDKWRIAVVLIFLVAAVVTPPDVVSMLGLALPLVLLYGLSIVLVKGLATRRFKKDA